MKIDFASMRAGAQNMQEVAAEVSAAVNELVGAAGDPSALGGNDTVGGIASAIYGGVIQYLQGCVKTLESGYGGHGQLLDKAAGAFERAESANAAMLKGLDLGGGGR